MAFTVQNICDEALRLIHVLRANQSFSTSTTIAPGYTSPNSQEYQICIDALNQILDGFSADGNTIYQVVHETSVLSGADNYTWGTGGQIGTARPTKIRAASVITADGSMGIAIVTPEKFETIVDRTVTGDYADMLVCDYGYPTATIFLWPAPNAGGTLHLWSYKPLTGVVYLSDAITFPPGYQEALKFNLALAISSEFPGAVLDPATAQMAQYTKQRLGALNAVTVGQPTAPLMPMPVQMPLMETDIEQGKMPTG